MDYSNNVAKLLFDQIDLLTLKDQFGIEAEDMLTIKDPKFEAFKFAVSGNQAQFDQGPACENH